MKLFLAHLRLRLQRKKPLLLRPRDWGSALRQNYHWIIAFIALFLLASYGGSANNFSSLHLVPVSDELGISRTEFSLIYSLKSIMSMVSSFFSGMILKRFGFRNCALGSMIVAGVGYFFLSQMTHFSVLLLVCFTMGVANTFCGTAGATRLISDWFHRYRGTVLGLVTASTGIGGSIFCVIQSAVIEKHTWRGSYFFCGILCILAFVLCLFLRNKPEDMGLKALGEGEEISGKRRRIADHSFPGMEMKDLRRTPSFYLMCLCTLLSCLGLYFAFSSVLPYLKDCGYSSAQAAGLQSAMLLLLTGTKVLTGICSDRFGIEKVNTVCSFCGATGLLLLALNASFPMAVFAVVIYSVSLPMLTITVPLLAYSLFGYRSQAQYTGIFISVIYASSFLSSPISNFIYDTLGSYRPAYLLGTALMVISGLLYLVLYRLARRDNKKLEAAS